MAEAKDVRSTLAANIKRVRRNIREMSGRQFIARLAERGVNLLPSGLTALEKGERRVTAEELLIIAQVLNTSVVDLLMTDDGAPIEVAKGVAPLHSDELFYWLRGDQPWPGADRDEFSDAAADHTRYMLKLFDSVNVRSLSTLATNIRMAEQPEMRRLNDPKLLARGLRHSLDEVNKAVEQLIQDVEGKDAEG
jgi:hypothetical protein